jgi:RHS repeat-associated protein
LLTRIEDRHGNSIQVVRDSANPERISTIKYHHTSNQLPAYDRDILTFTYPSAGEVRIAMVPVDVTAYDDGVSGAGDPIEWQYTLEGLGNPIRYVRGPEEFSPGTNDHLTHSYFYLGSPSNNRDGSYALLGRANARPSGITAGNEGHVYFDYYPNGQLFTTETSLSDQEHWQYNTTYNTTVATDTLGRQTSRTFFDYGELKQQTSANGSRAYFEVAPGVRKLSQTTYLDEQQTNKEYDHAGVLVSETTAAGITTRYTYESPAWDPHHASDPHYHELKTIEEISIDDQGNPDPRPVETYTYFSSPNSGQLGNPQQIKNAIDDATEYEYHGYTGQVTAVLSAKGVEIRDELGQTPANPFKTLFEYDTFGNVKKTSYGNGTLGDVYTHHDRFGNIGYTIDETTIATLTEYDAYRTAGRVTQANPVTGNVEIDTIERVYSNGLLSTVSLADGSVFRYDYDDVGRVIREINGDGTFRQTVYNADNTVAATIDELGNTTRFIYDLLGRVTQTIFADNSVSATIYDQRGYLVKEIDANGNATDNQYDISGKLTVVTAPDGSMVDNTYDRWGDLTLISDSLGVTEYTYDALHRRKTKSYFYNHIAHPQFTSGNSPHGKKAGYESFIYDANGNLESHTVHDSLNSLSTSTVVNPTQTTTFKYDSRNRLLQSFDADGIGMKTVYDDAGRVTDRFSKRGFISDDNYSSDFKTHYIYDEAGRLKQEVFPDPDPTDSTAEFPTIEYKRDDLGRTIEVIDPLGRSTYTFYDVNGRVIATQNALGQISRMVYDPAGNAVESISTAGRSRLSRFDERNRSVRIVLPFVELGDGSFRAPSSTTVYDGVDNVVSSTDANGNETIFQYDDRNRLSKQIHADSTEEQWLYDAHDNVVQYTDQLGRVTIHVNDMFGNLVETTLPDPDGTGPLTESLTWHRYDVFGNRISTEEYGNEATSTDDRRTRFAYDDLNRLQTTILHDPDTGAIDPSRTIQTQYDVAGNITKSIDILGRETDYRYDTLNRLTDTIYPDPNPNDAIDERLGMHVMYDLAGNQLFEETAAYNSSLTQLTSAQTDFINRVTSFEYDALNRVIYVVSPDPDNLSISSLVPAKSTSVYDVTGNVISQTDHLGRTTYSGFDQLGRNTSITVPDPDLLDESPAPVTRYLYDLAGNLQVETDALGRETTYEYDELNRNTKVVLPDPYDDDTAPAPYTQTTYLDNGTVHTTRDTRGNVTTFEYNDWDQLTTTTLPADNEGNHPVTENRYDQLGRLVKSIDALLAETVYEYDFWDRLTKTTLPDPDDDPNTAPHPPVFETRYDDAGRITRELDALGRATYHFYNERDERTQTTVLPVANDNPATWNLNDPDTITIYSSYDLAGNVTTTTDAEGRVTAFEYDNINRLVRTTLPHPDSTATANGPVTEQVYDSAGNITMVIDSLGRVTTRSFDRLNRLLTETLPDPDLLHSGLVAAAVTYTRDDVGNVIESTDHLGRTTVSEYDNLNRLKKTTLPDPDGAGYQTSPELTTIYDDGGNLVSSTDANGNTTTFEYDALNRLTKEILPNAFVGDRIAAPETTYKYDLNGNLKKVIDAAGRIVSYDYDALNRQTHVFYPDPDNLTSGSGNVPSFMVTEYDAVGNVTKETDHANRQTTYDYDHLNRLTDTYLPEPKAAAGIPHLETIYDKVGNVVLSIDANGNKTEFKYDQLNRMTEEHLPNPADGSIPTGPVTKYEYDFAGNTTKVTSALSSLDYVTEFEYDNLNRVTRTLGPDQGASTRSEELVIYDDAGNVRRKKTLLREPGNIPEYSTMSYQYDQLDRLTIATDANFAETEYQYDANGNQRLLVDSVGNGTAWQYNAHNQVVAETTPTSDATVRAMRVFEYDIVGNVVSMTDKRGFRTEYEYDELDRLYREQWLGVNEPLDSSGKTPYLVEILTEYDSVGRVKSSTHFDKSLSTNGGVLSTEYYEYDNLDRLTKLSMDGDPGWSVQTPTPGLETISFGYDYDANGNMTQRIQTIGSATVTTVYAYDGLSRLELLTQFGTNISDKSVEFEYRDDHSIDWIKRYSDQTQTNQKAYTDYSYDSAGRLNTIDHTVGTDMLSYDYTYNIAGWLTGDSGTVADGTAYEYDGTGQLTDADRTVGDDEQFDYDDNGNRLSTGYEVGGNNLILEDAFYTYEYDAEGNRTRRTDKGSGDYIEYEWDHRNRLVEVRVFESGNSTPQKIISYVYNTNGMRIVRTDSEGGQSDVTKYYLHDGDQQVAVLDNTQSVEHQYLDGPVLDQIFADELSTNYILWPLGDRQGTIQAVGLTDTNSTSVVDERGIDSFGNITSQTNSSIEHQHFFNGLQWDADAQLYFNRARWYDPAAGLFISQDPLGFDGGDTNLSRYTSNNPLNLVDPTGLFSFRRFINDIVDDVDDFLQTTVHDVGSFLETTARDVGDFLEEQWDRGNIQKVLLATSVIVTGGAASAAWAAAGAFGSFAAATGTIYHTVAFASASINAFQTFTGEKILDSDANRYLQGTSAILGGITGAANVVGSGANPFLSRTLATLDGGITGYEIISGDQIGDGSLSTLVSIGNIASSTYGRHNAGKVTLTAQGDIIDQSARFTYQELIGTGLQVANRGASLIDSGDPELQNALRALSITSGLWNVGTQVAQAREVVIRGQSPDSDGWRASRRRNIQQRERNAPIDPQLQAMFYGEQPGFIEELMLPPWTPSFGQSNDNSFFDLGPGFSAGGLEDFLFEGQLAFGIANATLAEIEYLRDRVDDARSMTSSYERLYRRKGEDGDKYFENYARTRSVLYKRQAQLYELTGQVYYGNDTAYRREQREMFQQAWEEGRVHAPSGGSWLDTYVINPVAGFTTGYGDVWTLGYLPELQQEVLGNEFNSAILHGNRSGYSYSVGQVAGVASFSYVTARAGAPIAGALPTSAQLVLGTGAGAYGVYQTGTHIYDTATNWNDLSGPEQLSAVGVPVAGFAGGYYGTRSYFSSNGQAIAQRSGAAANYDLYKAVRAQGYNATDAFNLIKGDQQLIWHYTRRVGGFVGDTIEAGAAGRIWATTHAPTGWHDSSTIGGWLKRNAYTGRGGQFTDVKLVTGAVRDEFAPVFAIGPARGWKRLGGQYSTTRPGSWSVTTDTILSPTARQSRHFRRDNLIYHTVDVGFWTVSGGTAATWGYVDYAQQQ